MKLIVLFNWLLLCYVVAVLGGWWTSAELHDWYLSLRRPRFAPPNWIFGPVWIVIYTLMGVAAWEIWLLPPSPVRTKALLLFFVQLALNLLWTWLFFREHDIANALAEVVLLWTAIGAEMVLVHHDQLIATWLLAPYLAWVTFAAILNFGYWRLNPSQE